MSQEQTKQALGCFTFFVDTIVFAANLKKECKESVGLQFSIYTSKYHNILHLPPYTLKPEIFE